MSSKDNLKLSTRYHIPPKANEKYEKSIEDIEYKLRVARKALEQIINSDWSYEKAVKLDVYDIAKNALEKIRAKKKNR